MLNTVSGISNREALLAKYRSVRSLSQKLCQPLATDDYQIQSMEQTSPPKWHIAHITWFFETFVLSPYEHGYKPFNPDYDLIFNSYYHTHGKVHPRTQRGNLSRPTVEEIYLYRAHIDEHIQQLIKTISSDHWRECAFRLALGLNHEQQHQELLLMDIKHNLSVNPLAPVYRQDLKTASQTSRPVRWVERQGGLIDIGHRGKEFAFDNETPRHQVLLHDHRLADRFVINREYLEFIEDGGYQNPALWLADGWAIVQKLQWRHPLYWKQQDHHWCQFTLGGTRTLNVHEPVAHLSFYEADAYARWAGKRLPLEEELETMQERQNHTGHFLGRDYFHPVPSGDDAEWVGNLWAWTASPYTAYPGFEPLIGSMGEYNGKFMANQMVLKGGCCITPDDHVRSSYRNFYYPGERWAFTGLRLAEDA